MLKSYIGLSAAFLLTLCSCGTTSTSQTDDVERTDRSTQIQQADELMIRAANVGDQPLGNIIIHFSSVDTKGKNATEQTEVYGNLAPTEVSKYHSINGSFRYAPMEAIVEGNRVRIGVTDFVGEYAIPNGNYTYEWMYGPSAMNGGKEDLNGQLVYDQTALDREIDSALDEEIKIAILDEYYRESFSTTGPTARMDSGDYGDLRTACVHQQTHQGSDRSKGVSSIIVYAKVVCMASYPRSKRIEQFNNLFPLPIRIELQAQNDSFSIVSYQFPQKGSSYEKDIKKIFSPSAIDEITTAKIEATTRNHLLLKLL